MAGSRRRTVLLGLLTMTSIAGCLGETNETSDDTEAEPRTPAINGRHLSVFPIVLMDPAAGERVADVHTHDEFAHWHRQPLTIVTTEDRVLTIVFRDDDDEELPLDSDEWSVSAEVRANEDRNWRRPAAAGIAVAIDDDELVIGGDEPAEADLRFHLRRDGDVVWTTPALAVSVTENNRD